MMNINYYLESFVNLLQIISVGILVGSIIIILDIISLMNTIPQGLIVNPGPFIQKGQMEDIHRYL